MVRIFPSPEAGLCIMSASDRNYFVNERRLVLHVLDRRRNCLAHPRSEDEKSRMDRELCSFPTSLWITGQPPTGASTMKSVLDRILKTV